MQHFYDGQIRRYLTQIVRLLSNFSYKDSQGELVRIPVLYGDMTRQVASIINDNSKYKIAADYDFFLRVLKIKNEPFKIIDHTITNTVVRPLRYLLSSKIKLTTMEYNKYLSRSIIYTYNTKLLYLNEINLDILSVFYSLILDNNFENAYKLSSHYNIQLKISEKFSKYFSDKIKKKTLQKLFKQ